MAKLIERYAADLLDIAGESGALADYSEQAVFIRDTLKNTECRRVIEHPHISAAEKKELIGALFAGKINDELLSFLYLGIEKGHEKFFVPGLSVFIARADRHIGRTKATVVCAAPLEENQIMALEKLLSEKLNRQVKVYMHVDPSVIGGLCVQMDGYVLDQTIKKKLNDMKVSLQRSTAHDPQA